ncbi:Outer membrane protein OmpA [Dyadobacter koreensis]|uniref:Outer membrane protein OmpA n=1 Tax=Dyadobacter koreensis TaxID=408657 RepID=A0A1H6XZ28_9BACT|nr:OmpA family protein [Dyadobacter koreensis]SEJ30100.1 Outer membrane protein OmpA [Dyadobacter koreensis]
MYTLLLSSLLWIYPQIPVSVHDDIFVMLRCYNQHNASGLPGKVSAIFKKSQRILGQSNESGILLLHIPDSTRYLLFEAEGYVTSKMAVSLSGKIEKGTEFNLAIPFVLKDSVNAAIITPQNLLSLSFDITENESLGFLMRNTNVSSRSNYSFSIPKGLHPFFLNDVLPGTYNMDASDRKGLLKREKIEINPGINFKAIHVEKRKYLPGDSLMASAVSLNSLKSAGKTIYFNQSSYELRPEAKIELDSISLLLNKKSELLAIVTGFTDNVGRRDLNMALAEYRARVVINYLKQKGVKPQQTTAKWKGPDLAAAPSDSHENKEKNRRVEIELITK